MTLYCPHCGSAARYTRDDVFGDWVVCPSCSQHFAWLEAQPGEPADARARGTILLAEDDDSLRRLAQRGLETLGYRVIAAADGDQALALYKTYENEIDLILSDMMMPKRSGGDLYRAVRARNGRVKFVLASACSAAELRRHGDLGPGVPFIQKPWSLPQLVELLRETLAA
jgi:CheY-like chemotaxis protein